MQQVHRKALNLPVNGPLEELVHMVKLDRSLEKVLPQKAATPHAMPAAVEDAMLDLRPHAVTLEKSGAAEADEVAASSHAWLVQGQKYHGPAIHDPK